MSKLPSYAVRKVKLTAQQDYDLKVTNIKFMETCPFYAYMYHAIGELVPTNEFPTAATDGRHIFINPDYVFAHKPSERVFIFAHEMDHLIKHHAQRFQTYSERKTLRGHPWDQDWANRCADWVINAGLVDAGIGSCNPDWLYDPAIKADELWEDVYERTYNNRPKPPTGGGSAGTYGGSGGGVRGQKGEVAGAGGDHVKANGGGFDVVLAPPKDPITGSEDLPDEGEFLEAIARAASAAKSMGLMPAHLQRFVDELLAPQVDWKDHIRMLVTGKIGQRHETWSRPNRRRLVTQPLVIIPGKKGYGADRVVVGVDTSGSIGDEELRVFFSEVGGVLKDCRPREIIVIGCDASVKEQDVHVVSNLDELDQTRLKGLGGGGGTNFCPVFDYVAEHDLRPEALIYLTDMMGSFPTEKPAYDVIWAATTDLKAPFGEHVRIKVEA